MFSMAGTTPDRTLSVIYATGDTATIPESHDRFEELLTLLFSGAEDEEVGDLVDVMLAVTKRMAQLSERVSIRGRSVYFDGDQLRGELADVLVEIFETGNPESLRPVVNFLEKAATNPSRQSVDDLYRWITKGDLIIHEDGDFLAYKGTRTTKDGTRTSINEGTAFVDGVEVTGHIPNPDGAVVTMPRSEVDDNSMEGCSTGLHAGTADYAFGFAWSETVLVKINPRDVVSVPTDSSNQKLRVCRYVVQGKVEERRTSRVFREPVADGVTAPLFTVIGFDVFDANEDDGELEVDGSIEESTLDDSVQTDEERLASEEALAALREKLQDLQTPPQSEAEAEAEAEAAEKVIRDAKGRFTSESAAKAVRNAKGQFTRQS
jgi:hypothetical protein